jgi:hypothetical protein
MPWPCRSSLRLLVAAAALSAGCTGSDRRTPLASVEAVAKHHAASPASQVPVHLSARVTYVDSGWGLYLVSDGKSAVQVDPAADVTMMFEGSHIELLGHTSDNEGRPLVVFERLLRARRDAPDAAVEARAGDILAGQMDGRRVRLTGTVRAARVQHARLRLDIDTDGDHVTAWMRQGSLSDGSPLIDELVTVTGVPFRHSQMARASGRSELLADGPPELVRVDTPAPSTAAAVVADNPAGHVYTSAATLRRETDRDALHGAPVRLHGVVTYFDPAWRLLFVQDDTAGIFVNLNGVDPGLREGDEVDLEGSSTPGEFAPSVRYVRHVRRGDGRLPTPVRPPIRELSAGVFDSQWVEALGIVRRVSVDANQHLDLDLDVDGTRMRAQVPGFVGALPTHLVDAELLVTAVAGAIFNTRTWPWSVRLRPIRSACPCGQWTRCSASRRARPSVTASTSRASSPIRTNGRRTSPTRRVASKCTSPTRRRSFPATWSKPSASPNAVP